MAAVKCPLCGLPYLSRPQARAEGIRGHLSNSGDEHRAANETHYVLRRESSGRCYAVNKDDLEPSDALRELATFQAPIDPDYKPPEGGKKTLGTGIYKLLYGPGNGQRFQVLNVPSR